MSKGTQSKEGTKKEPRERKEYEKPSLKEFGSLEDLTLSGGSGSSDFLGMQSDMGMN